MLVLGIDDSGRGPLIGPMIMAGVLLKKEDEERLKRLGVRDSKKLTDKRREILAAEIRKVAVGYEIFVVHPNEIDGRQAAGLNLNKIEAIKAAEIINKLNKKNEKINVVIDCPSNNITKWHLYLVGFVKNTNNLNFIIEHKADVNHVACSAASILAKVQREKEVADLKKKLGVDFGSGYTSDPITQKFLKEHYKDHKKDGIFRETWQTLKTEKAKKEQKSIVDF
ncbi:ribonuclease HII [Candidatus Pacearchaeota archaeon]|nr:ribonuclease HII [Candidatus Pacearchaeota archaeon]